LCGYIISGLIQLPLATFYVATNQPERWKKNGDKRNAFLDDMTSDIQIWEKRKIKDTVKVKSRINNETGMRINCFARKLSAWQIISNKRAEMEELSRANGIQINYSTSFRSAQVLMKIGFCLRGP